MAKSEYLQREEAAKKQLGAKGVKKRVKQLPTAARAFTKEMTGIDISRKGVSVDPLSLAMALPVGKVLKAAKVLRAAGKASQAAALSARVLAKEGGRNLPKSIALAEKMWTRTPGSSAPTAKTVKNTLMGTLPREASESVFPKLPSRGGDAPSLLRGQRDLRTFDRYADLTNEGAGRFKSQNLLETILQSAKTRSGMKSVAEARALAKRAAARKATDKNR